jgi:hypothetical protein
LDGKQYRLAKRMRWAARVIGLLAATVCLAIVVINAAVEGLPEGGEAINQAELVQGIMIGVLGVVGLTGSIVSWWRERLAGVLLVLTAVGFGIHVGLCAGRNHFMAWLMIGFPYLVAAVLLFSSWRLSRKIP